MVDTQIPGPLAKSKTRLTSSPPEDESHGNGKQAPTNLSRESRGTLTGSGLDLETKIFSPSGRGGTFFLTSLFIEPIECGEGFQISGCSRVTDNSEMEVPG